MNEKTRFMLVLIAPAVLALVFFQIVPIIVGTNVSFRDWSLHDPKKTWVGLANYAYVLKDEAFLQVVLPNTFGFMFVSVIASLVLGLLVALLLTGTVAEDRFWSETWTSGERVLNALLEVDLSTVQGNQDGGLLQTLLTEFCRGNNFDWKSSTDAKDQVFNRKVLAKWHTSWGQVVQERRAWINLGKLSEEEGVEFLAD